MQTNYEELTLITLEQIAPLVIQYSKQDLEELDKKYKNKKNKTYLKKKKKIEKFRDAVLTKDPTLIKSVTEGLNKEFLPKNQNLSEGHLNENENASALEISEKQNLECNFSDEE